METLKLAQALERFRERQAQIDASLAEMAAEEAGENERLSIAEQAIEVQREQIRQLQLVMDAARASFCLLYTSRCV